MRRAALVILLVLCSYGPAFAAAAVVQTVNANGVEGDETPTFGGNVTTGNAVICSTIITSGGGSSFTISDATNGNYDVAIAHAAGTGTQDLTVQYKRNVTGGFTQVTIDATSTTVDYDYACWEVSGLDNSLSALTGDVSEGSVTSHTCASSGLTGTGFAVCLAQMFDSRTTTEGSGWTLVTPATNGQVIERKIATFTSDTGAFSTSVAVASNNVMVLFREPSAGGGCSGTFCDAFDRADSADLGANWDSGYTVGNALEVVGQQIRATVLNTRSLESVNAVSLANNQRARITVATITGAQVAASFVILRAATPTTSTFYRFATSINDTFTSRIDKFEAGVQTVLTTENATTWAAGDILEGEVVGTTLRLYRIVGATSNLLLETTDANIASGRAGAGAFVATGGSLANSEVEDFMAADASTGRAGVTLRGAGR